MFCPNCGTQNADGAKFCAKCGGALQSAAPVNQQPVSESRFRHRSAAEPMALRSGKKPTDFVSSHSYWELSYLWQLVFYLGWWKTPDPFQVILLLQWLPYFRQLP